MMRWEKTWRSRRLPKYKQTDVCYMRSMGGAIANACDAFAARPLVASASIKQVARG